MLIRLYDLIGEAELQKRLDKVRETILTHAPCEIPVVKPNADDLDWIKRRIDASEDPSMLFEVPRASTP